jgi:hypothetical protein
MSCKLKEPLGEHAFGFLRLIGKERAVFVGEGRGDSRPQGALLA